MEAVLTLLPGIYRCVAWYMIAAGSRVADIIRLKKEDISLTSTVLRVRWLVTKQRRKLASTHYY